MVSTLLGYKLYASNMSKTLERLENSTAVKKEAAYYNENIGKVKTVDDLLDNYRLYSYAMKAYGLEDQMSSKGLIRKVLESDLKSSSSFANQLADKKYRTFAAAFNFGTNAASETKVVQNSTQTESMVDSYNDRRVRQGVVAAQKTNYYQANIGSVKTVDDLLNNTALYEVVLRSIGADPETTSKDFARQALTNTLPNGTTTTNPIGWMKIHELFNFDQNGDVIPVAGTTNVLFAQDPSDKSQLIYNYNVATGNNNNPAAAAFNTDFFKLQTAAGRIGDVDDLLDNPRLFEYVATAFGFDPTIETPDYFKKILSSDSTAWASDTYLNMMANPNVPTSRKEQFTNLRAAFNFDKDGNAISGGMQTADQQQKLEAAYFRNYTVIAISKDSKQTSSFKFLMDNINSVTDLLTKDPAFGNDAINYALKAFDIDPKETSLFQVRRVLTSDVSDPNSYVNKLKDERFVKLANAFNFDSEGKAAPQRLVQSTSAQTTTGVKYKESFGENLSKAKQELIKTDTKAYLEAIPKLTSLDALLKDTKTLNYALKAYGLDDNKLSTADLKKILTSDLSDKKSFAYTGAEDGSYVKFAQAFSFTTSGTVSREAFGSQSGAAKLTTANKFLLQTLETKAGDEGQEGVRLALYFRRTASDLTSMTSILADKAALKVVMTAFSLPTGFSQLDTDKQVSILEKKFKLEDFKDSKKLDKFISRFSAMYDMANGDTSNASSPVLQLMSGASSSTSGAGNSLLALL
ncbi:DUF1217 domain-containing protein [Aureimonas psammosilenae]|uniref:DUF1217 domain-containing protein n=1 Tax=Aureimonas psammosilenae TaxID=2495496 RepID=UPI001260A80C|nr:DUF1217 domain-containing protein [Aureimonas psammosilenae]